MSDFHKALPRLLGTLAALVLLCANALAQTLSAPVFEEERSSEFKYDDATGLLIEERIEPTKAALCVVTSYQLDPYGNRKQTTTSNCADTSLQRVASASYSNAAQPDGTLNGSYATSVWNALNHAETKLVDPRFGLATSQTARMD
jgi:hypothetical protein